MFNLKVKIYFCDDFPYKYGEIQNVIKMKNFYTSIQYLLNNFAWITYIKPTFDLYRCYKTKLYQLRNLFCQQSINLLLHISI